jgi:hypothetical protein
MSTKLFDSKIQHGFEETTMIRQELKTLMRGEAIIQNIKNYLATKGVDRIKIDIIVNQAFKDKEERDKYLQAAKQRKMISVLFLVLFIGGVTGWFYIWGDWITYFAGVNFVLFLFFIQQASSLRGKAEIYEEV